MRKPYFPSRKRDPSPLRVTVERRVRFEETDPLAIVWHGRYASYFEDARSAAGEKYGIGYLGPLQEWYHCSHKDHALRLSTSP